MTYEPLHHKYRPQTFAELVGQEAIAQTLFKHWFVDFEFPNKDGKPYKSSGGVMRTIMLVRREETYQIR